jgi:predicted TIM-barrel fold metal-dependent hydrolase
MDILDTQLHISPDQIPTVLGGMDALGIQSVLLDEFWMRRPYGDPDFFEPGYALPGGAWRSTYPTAETASLLHPDRFGIVLRVDRNDPDLEAVIRHAGQHPHVRALRVLPTWSPHEAQAFAAGAYAELFALAQDVQLPVFAYAPGQVEPLAGYAAAVPELTLIIDHCGMPQPGMPGDHTEETATAAYFDRVLELAELPNLALKWSHDREVFHAPTDDDTRRYLREVIDRFGAHRILWASDRTVLPARTWSSILGSVRDNPDLTDDEKGWILGASARQLLNWTPPVH